jgi:putative transposase
MYPSDLTDKEWEIIKPLILIKKKGFKRAEHNVRCKLNAIFYVLKSGCQWRMLPKDYGDWQKNYSQFRRWRNTDIFQNILYKLNVKVRVKNGRKETPSLLIMDTQSIKTVQKGG